MQTLLQQHASRMKPWARLLLPRGWGCVAQKAQGGRMPSGGALHRATKGSALGAVPPQVCNQIAHSPYR